MSVCGRGVKLIIFIIAGEHLTEEFKTNINRFQKVPCIIDDGFKLAESIAVLRYYKLNHYTTK